MPANFIDLTGKHFGRWTVIRYAGYRRGAIWECRCECGKIKNIRSDHLRYGKSTSCGCYRAEVTAKETAEKISKHGMWNTRLYREWIGMKQRCSPSCAKQQYDRYYGRGIRVCDEWKDDFSAFAKWALSNGYSDELSIDRIDNDGNYEPSNCRWTSDEVQANNRNTSKFITYAGKKLSMVQWAKKLNMNYSTLQTNLKRGKAFEEIAKERACNGSLFYYPKEVIP